MADILTQEYKRLKIGEQGSVCSQGQTLQDLQAFQTVLKFGQSMQADGLISILNPHFESHTGERMMDLFSIIKIK
jgi:hypothetical protein